ncbi:MAG: plasmid pRiA4b ORF-3 family protein [Chloroflexota bacterium]
MPARVSHVYQIKISLDDTHPPIWRRILAPANYTLFQLHEVIQTVMGWQNYHLHMFTIGDAIYGDPADDEFGDLGTQNEKAFKLKKLFPAAGVKFKYEYDFGDSWEHTLRIEKILPAEKGQRYPQCVAGKRACPPEDVGGVWGYEGFLEALADPKHPEHDEYLEWAGGEFDPAAFDLEEVNQQLGRPASRNWIEDEEEAPEESRGATMPAWLDPARWEKLFDPRSEAAAEGLALRKDTLALLTYLRDNKVTGTQATGNLTLKAVAAIAAAFVNPPKLEDRVGNHVYRFRNEDEVWPVYFVHVLASIAGLLSGGQGRRWRLTRVGESFLEMPTIVQVYTLFAAWWLKTNWLIAYPFEGMGEQLPFGVQERLHQRLLACPAGQRVAFEAFADSIIQETGLRWNSENQEHAHSFLQGAIERMVIDPLVAFGALAAQHETLNKYGWDSQYLVSFHLTPLGVGLLRSLEGAH